MHVTDCVSVMFPGPKVVQLQVTPLPPLAPRQVRVRAHATLLSSGTDRVCLSGDIEPGTHWGRWVRYPFAPGYSMVGTVEQVGPEAVSVAVGDRVVVRAPHASHATALEADVLPVPDDVDDDSAVWFALSAIAQHAVRIGGQKVGEHVVVAGTGPVGQLVARYAEVAGAVTVICVGNNLKRGALAARANAAVHVPRASAVEHVHHATNGLGADTTYDVTGASEALAVLSAMTRKNGTVVVVGDTATPGLQSIGGNVLRRTQTVRGVHDSDISRAPRSPHVRWPFDENVALFMSLIRQRRLNTAELITQRFAWSEAREAFSTLGDEEGGHVGIVLDWTGPANDSRDQGG